MNSPRLGFYVISIGIILQVFGLAGGSWMGNGDQAGDVVLGGPSYVLLILGMAVVVLGAAIGSLSLSSTLTPTNGDVPRLLPLTPLVFLAVVSIGTGAFAYQASNTGAQSSGGGTTTPAPLAAFQPDPTDCPDGYYWHEIMEHCMTPEQIVEYNEATASLDGLTNPVATPVCPAGSAWQQAALACVSSSGAAVPGDTAQPSCPEGYFWHPVMVHCMSVAFQDPSAVDCPSGYAWDPLLLYCTPVSVGPGPTGTPPPNATPVCPTGTFWHPVMNHCMPTEEPPTVPPTPTATPRPGETPTTTPTAPPSVTPTPTPVCPAGFFWHPSMGHCMSETCPPPLVLNPDTLYCEMPGSETTPTPAPTMTPTPEPTPACPAGFFWHPSMGHCMSETCPEGLVLNPVTLYCELPASSGSRSSG